MLEIILPIISTISTGFIAYYSYVANKLANEIKTQNTIQQDKVNKIFWAMVFSGVLVDTNTAHIKQRVGFIIKLFGWEEIKSDIKINADDLLSVVNANCSKYVDEIIKNTN